MREVRIVWMNGELIPEDEVRISPFDLGVMLGVGLFETLPAYEGRVFALEAHRSRMESGMPLVAAPGVPLLSEEKMRDAMHAVILANGLERELARVRVSLTGGANPLQGGDRPGNYIVTAAPQPQPAPLVRLGISPFLCHDHGAVVGAKTTSYADPLVAWRVGLADGADEVVRMNTDGQLCECAMANVFLVKNGIVRTPELESGCLAGVTRGIVLELCHELGIESVECELNMEDLYAADEVFITSSMREVQAAVMLEAEEGRAMPVSQKLQRAYRKRVQKELGL